MHLLGAAPGQHARQLHMLHALGAAQADVGGGQVGDRGTLRLDLDVTAVSGTAPRLHVQVETRKAYASGTWRVVDAFDIATAVGAQRRAMGGCDRFVRVAYTLEGTTPSFAFSVSGEAV